MHSCPKSALKTSDELEKKEVVKDSMDSSFTALSLGLSSRFQGVPPTGKEVPIDYINSLTVLDDKIVEEWLN